MKQKLPRVHARLPQLFSIATSILVLSAGSADAQTNAAPAPAAAPPSVQATDISQIPGARIIKTNGVLTGISIKDCEALTPADFQLIRQTESLKMLGFGVGLNEDALKILSGMPAVERISTSGIKISDGGLVVFATFKNLHELNFYEAHKDFPGTGLAALAVLPHLESITVAGTSFVDSGMAALGQLSHLKRVNISHDWVTSEGVKALGSLKELTTLEIGQWVTFKPPTTVNDDTIAVVATLSSLESLSVSEARLSLPALSKLTQLPKLKTLTLRDIEIPESDVTALKQQLPNVQIKWNAPNEIVKKRIDTMFGPEGDATPLAPAPPPRARCPCL